MKRQLVRIALAVLAAFVALLAAAAGVLFTAFPRTKPPSTARIEATPALVARGAYLANNVAICVDCHSERDWSRFAAPVVPGSFGRGGERFGHDQGLPGEFFAKNITPAGIGGWSDGEVVAAMTGGVSRDGTPLFPIMPWPDFAHLCERDAHAIVAWLRTLPPVDHEVPGHSVDFPVSLLLRTMPAPATLAQRCPTPADGVAYGKYLVTAAACTECHTRKVHGKPVSGMAFAGGAEFPLASGGVVRSANLTPDVETGIGNWPKETFVAHFKSHADPSTSASVAPGSFNTVMPWTQYARMSDEDLGAIYEYLRTLAPVKNPMERFTPPPGAPAATIASAR